MAFAALVSFVLILAGVSLSWVRWIPAMMGWVLCALGVLSGLTTALTIFVSGQWQHGTLALIAAAPAVFAIPKVVLDLRFPRINDVTTDADSPPAFVAALSAPANQGRDMSWPTKNGPIVRRGYENVGPLLLEEGAESVLQRAHALAKDQNGWVVTHYDPSALRLEGEVTTSIFRFVDDFVVVLSADGELTRVDMRSKSRDGLVDAGENARRIRGFLALLGES